MTRYADRKAKIRAYQALYPGMTYSQAARQLDAGAQPAPPLTPGEPPSAFDTLAATLEPLAAALGELGQHDLAAPLTTRIDRWREQAPQARALAQATQDAYDAMVNAPVGTPRARRRALEKAFEAAQYNEDFMYQLEVAAGILDRLQVEFTADAIRGMEFHLPVPPPVNTPTAQHAHAAAKALVAAAAIPFRGDEEWTACQHLVEEARDLARATGGRCR